MNNSDIMIEHAAGADAAALRAVAIAAKGYWGDTPELLDGWANTWRLSADEVEAMVAFKAVRDGRILGWYGLIRQTPLHMEHLWVAPDRIGTGLGRRLFEHALDQARASGATELEWTADPHAVGFYEHMGGTVVGRTWSEWERWLPLMRMQIESNQ